SMPQRRPPFANSGHLETPPWPQSLWVRRSGERLVVSSPKISLKAMLRVNSTRALSRPLSEDFPVHEASASTKNPPRRMRSKNWQVSADGENS
ncbi:unnamed protein product, partial [Aphanomyces euteiches]